MNKDMIPPKDYLKAWQKRHDNARKPFAELLGRHALQLGVIDAVGQDTDTIVGLVRHLRMQLEIPGELERIRALGEAETDWYQPLPPPPATEKLILILEEEPGPALAACLARDGFIRVTTEPEARPIVAMGRGNYKSYRALLEGSDRVERGGPPGGILRGTPFTVGDSVGLAPMESEALVSSSRAGPAPLPSTAAPEEPSLPRSAKIAPVSGLLGARPYRVAEVERGDDALPLHKLPRERWMWLAAEVACQEGPVDFKRVATRAGELFGQSCVRGQTIEKFKACLIEHTAGSDPLLVQTEGQFYHAAGRPVRARDRSGCDARLRTVGNLPRIEIRAAVTEALETGCQMARSELVTAAARLLGFVLKVSRNQAPLAERIDVEIDGLIEDSDVAEQDGVLALAAASAAPVQEEASARAEPSADRLSDASLPADLEPGLEDNGFDDGRDLRPARYVGLGEPLQAPA